MAFISYLSRVHFDDGVIGLLSGELDHLGIRRPLVTTDPGVVAAGLLDRVLTEMPAPPPVFDATPSNPTESAVMAALDIYTAEECDGVIALGGGSAIDLGKSVALLSTHGGALGDYGILVGGTEKIGPVAPMAAIPTTAGTGAEVGRAATVTLSRGDKVACVSTNLIPKAAICDPELTYSLPPAMTAATGMDALGHGIEASLSTVVNPPAEAIALDCVARVTRFIGRAVADGGDREARWEMLMAALEGGFALLKGLGAVHVASHPLGALNLHHGALNAVLLPAVLRFNRDHAVEKFDRLRQAADLPPGADLAEWIESLNEAIGMPAGLRAMGVRDDQLDAIATMAAGDNLNRTNPRPATVADYRLILKQSM